MKGERGSNTMNITDVRVRKIAKEGKMKAVVSITIDDEFVVHDIKVIEGESNRSNAGSRKLPQYRFRTEQYGKFAYTEGCRSDSV